LCAFSETCTQRPSQPGFPFADLTPSKVPLGSTPGGFSFPYPVLLTFRDPTFSQFHLAGLLRHESLALLSLCIFVPALSAQLTVPPTPLLSTPHHDFLLNLFQRFSTTAALVACQCPLFPLFYSRHSPPLADVVLIFCPPLWTNAELTRFPSLPPPCASLTTPIWAPFAFLRDHSSFRSFSERHVEDPTLALFVCRVFLYKRLLFFSLPLSFDIKAFLFGLFRVSLSLRPLTVPLPPKVFISGLIPVLKL